MSVISGALTIEVQHQPNTNMTSFLDTIPLSQTATAKTNAVWACHHSILSIPPTVSSHRPALYSSAGTAQFGRWLQ